MTDDQDTSRPPQDSGAQDPQASGQNPPSAVGGLDLPTLHPDGPSARESAPPSGDDHPLGADDLAAVYDVPVQVSAVLGRSTMPVNQLLRLGRGAVIELDRKVGDAIDIYVNNRLVARGEVIVIDDHLGISMTEMVKSDRA